MVIIFRMLADSDDDVSVEHKVNGVPLHELPDVEKCDSELAFPFFDYSEQQSNVYLKTYDSDGNIVLYEEHKFCVEQYNYGMHTFTVRRYFKNSNTGLDDYVEMESYESVRVVPKLAELFSDVENNAYFSFLHMHDCWEDNAPVISDYCSERLSSIKAASRLHYTLDCWVTVLIYVSIHVYYLWWVYSLIRYVLTLTLPNVFRQSVVNTLGDVGPRTESRPKPEPTTAKHYDVFLAYAMEDVRVSQRIRSHLLLHELVVYDCQEDVPPNRPTLTAWDDAMLNCSSFVVIVSANYLADPELSLQFQNIHHLMLEQEVSEDRLVLVVEGRCHIPGTLGPLPVIDLGRRDWEQQLEWWALRLKGQFTNKTVLRQLRRDLQRDSREFLELNRRDDDVKQIIPELSFLVRKLEAICATATPFDAIDGCERERRPQQLRHRIGVQAASGETYNQIDDVSGYEDSDLEPESESEVGERRRTSSVAVRVERYSPSQLLRERDQEGPGEVPQLGSAAYRSAGLERQRGPYLYDVFLTYCEESPSDRTIAGELKGILEGRSAQHTFFEEGQGLNVYDGVQDLLGGQAQVHLVSPAAQSAAFVVIFSPAYCLDPSTRRLHFPQVLQAVFNDRVEVENVLIVLTSGTLDSPQRGTREGDLLEEEEEEEEERGPAARPDYARGDDRHSDTIEQQQQVKGEGPVSDGGFVLPVWFKAFTRIHWSPGLGLYEGDRLRCWARHVRGLTAPPLPTDEG